MGTYATFYAGDERGLPGLVDAVAKEFDAWLRTVDVGDDDADAHQLALAWSTSVVAHGIDAALAPSRPYSMVGPFSNLLGQVDDVSTVVDGEVRSFYFEQFSTWLDWHGREHAIADGSAKWLRMLGLRLSTEGEVLLQNLLNGPLGHLTAEEVVLLDDAMRTAGPPETAGEADNFDLLLEALSICKQRGVGVVCSLG